LEYRRSGYEQKAGDEKAWSNGGYVFDSGPLAGKSPNPGASGLGGLSPDDASRNWRSNVSVYGDLDQKLTDRWEGAVAGRYEHYSDFGSAWSGKVSTRYELLDWLAARTAVSNGFHAPTLPQQFILPRPPLTVLTRTPGSSCSTPPTTLGSTTPMAVALGARSLKPEKSINYSVGFVAEPTSKLQVTLDFYQIDLKDRILPITFTGSQVQSILQEAGLLETAGHPLFGDVYPRQRLSRARPALEPSDPARHRGDWNITESASLTSGAQNVLNTRPNQLGQQA